MQISHEFFYMVSSINKMAMNSISASRLSPPQTITLIMCKTFWLEHGLWPKPSQISDALEVTPASVTPVINRLERDDYIRREYSKTDRREVYICLTEKGEAEFEHIHGYMKEYFERLKQSIGEEGVVAFMQLAKDIQAFNQQEKNRKTLNDNEQTKERKKPC